MIAFNGVVFLVIAGVLAILGMVFAALTKVYKDKYMDEKQTYTSVIPTENHIKHKKYKRLDDIMSIVGSVCLVIGVGLILIKIIQ